MGGGDGGGGGNESGMMTIAVAVALVVLVCVSVGIFAYFKCSRAEQIKSLGAAFNNLVYEQPGTVGTVQASQDDGELYEAQQGAAGQTYQDTCSMEKAPGVQTGRGQQQTT